MKDLLTGLEFLGIPTIIGIILAAIYLIIDFKTKVVPEIISIKKHYEKKKELKEQERRKQEESLERLAELQAIVSDMKNNVDASLNEMKSHYSPEKLAERDAWMNWVNARADVYDASVIELTKFKESLEVTKELTLDLYININRNRIIDFAGKVINEKIAVSREEFNRVFKIYNEYEEILEKYGKTNGEVEVSIRIIRDAYETHMRNHTFIEDFRGYN